MQVESKVTRLQIMLHVNSAWKISTKNYLETCLFDRFDVFEHTFPARPCAFLIRGIVIPQPGPLTA
jgi:hypothetical protein